MAVSAYLVYAASDPRRRFALALWWTQLVINAAWTWLFFVLRSGVGALLDVALLLALLAILVTVSWRVRPLAGVLLLPYLGWTVFATALTIGVWMMNPAAL